MYFDDSLYENRLHFKLDQYLKDYPMDDDNEEIIIKANNEEEYNAVLDALCNDAENNFQIFGVSKDPMELIVMKDPREGYRKFNEKYLSDNEEKDTQ